MASQYVLSICCPGVRTPEQLIAPELAALTLRVDALEESSSKDTSRNSDVTQLASRVAALEAKPAPAAAAAATTVSAARGAGKKTAAAEPSAEKNFVSKAEFDKLKKLVDALQARLDEMGVEDDGIEDDEDDESRGRRRLSKKERKKEEKKHARKGGSSSAANSASPLKKRHKNDPRDRSVLGAAGADSQGSGGYNPFDFSPYDDSMLPPPPTQPSVLPFGWTPQQDPQTGRTYFCNQHTGATQWERPMLMQSRAHLPPPAPSAPPQNFNITNAPESNAMINVFSPQTKSYYEAHQRKEINTDELSVLLKAREVSKEFEGKKK